MNKEKKSLRPITTMTNWLICLVFCWWLYGIGALTTYAEPYQAVKWPKASQKNILAKYKITVFDQNNVAVKTIVIDFDKTPVAWIHKGVVVFDQPADGTGIPCRVVLDYGAIALAPGDYIITIQSGNFNDIFSDLSLSAKIHVKKNKDRETIIFENEAGAVARKIVYTETWFFEIIPVKKTQM